MKTFEIKLGHGTNSSSTHTFVRVPKEELPLIKDTLDLTDLCFYRQFEIIKEPNNKLSYLKSQIYFSFKKEYADLLCAYLAIEDLPYGHIDHQSSIHLPTNVEFIEDYMNYLLKEDVLILCKSDEQDPRPFIYFTISEEKLISDIFYPCRFVTSLRKFGDWWVLYDKYTGNRATISFKTNPSDPTPVFETPLQIDVKITNKCDMGCSFCYQDSKNEPDDIEYSQYNTLFEQYITILNPFEIAIGGGNPLEYKDLKSFCRHLNNKGISVHLTLNINHLTRREFVIEDFIRNYSEHVMALGISISKPTTDYENLTIELLMKHFAINYHIIPALHNEEQITNIIDNLVPCLHHPTKINHSCINTNYNISIKHGVILLGYKNTGRGKIADDKYKALIEHERKILKYIFDKYEYDYRIAVDTKIIEDHEELIKEICEDIYTGYEVVARNTEGTAAIYCDLTTCQLNNNSYTELKPVNLPIVHLDMIDSLDYLSDYDKKNNEYYNNVKKEVLSAYSILKTRMK